MSNPVIFDHPLIQHKLSLLRDKQTGSKEFRELVEELSMLMAYEVTRGLPLKKIEIETPMGKTVTRAVAGKKLGIVPILRAGLGMVDGMLRIVPTARVGHIGLYRDPDTFKPVEYYCKLPSDVSERELILLDPMLATGGTASEAVDYIKKAGCKSIKFVTLIAAPEGIERLLSDHPDVEIFVAAIDEALDSHGYIVPGLGDAGDRLFGTK